MNLGLSGCATYQSAPLDSTEYHKSWVKRSPDSKSVIDFASQLAKPLSPYDPSDGIQRIEAEIIALHFNPKLHAERQKAKIYAKGIPYADLWDDPTLSMDLVRILENVQHDWLGGASLEWTLPISGRLAKQKDKAVSQAYAALTEIVVEENSLIKQLRESWLLWSIYLQRVELNQAFLEEIDKINRIAQNLVQAGEISRVQARVFSIEHSNITYQIQKLKRNIEQEQTRIKSILGFIPDAPIQLIPSLEQESGANLESNWQDLLTAQNPLLAYHQAHYDLAEKDLELKIRKQYPDINLGTGFASEEGDPRLALGISLPIPLLNRNRKAIAEAQATRDAERAAWEAAYQQLISDYQIAQLSLLESQERYEYLTTNLAPLIDQQVEEQLSLAQLGELDVLLFLDAIKEAHNTKLDILDARHDEAMAQINIQSFFEQDFSLKNNKTEN